MEPRQRYKLDADRLERALRAFEAGGIEAVIEEEQIGERQAYRLLARARASQQP
jgi:hypothetical protein